MGLLTRVELEAAANEATGGKPQITTSLDIGKTLALTIVGALLAIAALVLYLTDRGEAASGFMALVGLILGAGFGLYQGEQSGAEEAARLLQDR